MSNKYEIKKIPTAKHDIPQRKCARDGIMPNFPFSFMLSGRSGSGKTNLLMNILTNKDLYASYFHYTIVFSPTAGKMDDTYDILKLPKENFKATFSKEDLDQIIEVRTKQVEEKGIDWVAKNSRMLIIMDDVIANRSFLESETALKMFALLRHYLVATVILMQSYKKLPRSMRINVMALAVFPGTQSEVEVLIDEICPSGIKKRDFAKVIDYCTDGKYSFLYINTHTDRDKQIRKNLNDVVDLKKYKNIK
jgi:hypothetical protein